MNSILTKAEATKAVARNGMKFHKGYLPSPVIGMDLGHWLSLARTTEKELEGILVRDDLDAPQREKILKLLQKVRESLRRQLDKINAAPSS